MYAMRSAPNGKQKSFLCVTHDQMLIHDCCGEVLSERDAPSAIPVLCQLFASMEGRSSSIRSCSNSVSGLDASDEGSACGAAGGDGQPRHCDPESAETPGEAIASRNPDSRSPSENRTARFPYGPRSLTSTHDNASTTVFTLLDASRYHQQVSQLWQIICDLDSAEVDVNILPTSSESFGVTWSRQHDGTAPSRGNIRLSGTTCDADLASVAGPDFNYDRLKNWFSRIPPHEDFAMMCRWMTSNELSKALIPIMKRRTSKRPARISPRFGVDRLLESGTIQRAVTSGILTSPVFRVMKSDGISSRFILDGREFDLLFKEVFEKPPRMPELNINLVIERLLDTKWKVISSADIRSMFFQFGLHPSLRSFFHFSMRSSAKHFEDFELCALPMGICFAPAWAQHVSNYIIEIVRRNLPTANFDIIAWIDNFIVVSPDQEKDRIVRQQLDNIFDELYLRAKPWEGGADQLTVLGVSIDLRRHIATPTEKSVANLARAYEDIQSTHVTPRDFMRWFGQVIWISFAVAKIPLCFFPNTMTTVREVCREHVNLDEENMRLTSAVLTECRRLFELLRDAKRTSSLYKPGTPTIWTDACSTGIGAINPATSQALHIPLHIAEGKMNAAELFCGYIASMIFGVRDHRWITDNTAAFHAFVKGHSPSAAMDMILRLWIPKCPASDAGWISTRFQSSDIVSRLQQRFTDEELAANCIVDENQNVTGIRLQLNAEPANLEHPRWSHLRDRRRRERERGGLRFEGH